MIIRGTTSSEANFEPGPPIDPATTEEVEKCVSAHFLPPTPFTSVTRHRLEFRRARPSRVFTWPIDRSYGELSIATDNAAARRS